MQLVANAHGLAHLREPRQVAVAFPEISHYGISHELWVHASLRPFSDDVGDGALGIIYRHKDAHRVLRHGLAKPVELAVLAINPHVRMGSPQLLRIISPRDADAQIPGHAIGKPEQVKRSPVREDALRPSHRHSGELVVQHVERAVDSTGKPVDPTPAQGVLDHPGREAGLLELRCARDAAELFDMFRNGLDLALLDL